jgi:hypothetical protein
MNGIKINIIEFAFIALLLSAFILIGMYPYHPNSFIGWAVLYIISLPLVLFFEILSKKLFFNKVTNKIGKTGRIIYGVIIVGLLMILSNISFSWMEPYLGKWGS